MEVPSNEIRDFFFKYDITGERERDAHLLLGLLLADLPREGCKRVK